MLENVRQLLKQAQKPSEQLHQQLQIEELQNIEPREHKESFSAQRRLQFDIAGRGAVVPVPESVLRCRQLEVAYDYKRQRVGAVRSGRR